MENINTEFIELKNNEDIKEDNTSENNTDNNDDEIAGDTATNNNGYSLVNGESTMALLPKNNADIKSIQNSKHESLGKSFDKISKLTEKENRIEGKAKKSPLLTYIDAVNPGKKVLTIVW
eukprot:CAMPEP_0114660758 /NCGR_PEP_ID=MMETSP0191-20121206/20862_1 /TAXON_ID=126664 /ORGANISM="Sorites sp." /LENGTH=119 /DNA_ID=CAMNT_0001890689 /DNA_START=1463 /DNA_END=1819 /DNA_ORIENTATION=-